MNLSGKVKMSRDKIVLANWKAYLSPRKAEQWLIDFAGEYSPFDGIKVILAVPSICLEMAQKECSRLHKVHIAAQDVSHFPQGGYTGSLPASWLTGMAEYVLVGHRERRTYFRESVQDVANKVRESVSEELVPIVCLNREVFNQQVAAIEPADLDRMIAAYTPDDAESLEIARSPQAVADAVESCKERLSCPVLYGGGVSVKNIAGLIALPQLAGVMAASASLDPSNFMLLLNRAADALAGAS